jgi:hypothetical protein
MKHLVDFEKLKGELIAMPLDKRGLYITKAVAAVLDGGKDFPWIMKKKAAKVLSKVYTEAFNAFWEAYPRRNGVKQGKPAAFKAWQKTEVDEKELLGLTLKAVGIQKRLDGWTKDNGTFIPMASTYLNARGWEDELPELDDVKTIKDEFGRDMEV